MGDQRKDQQSGQQQRPDDQRNRAEAAQPRGPQQQASRTGQGGEPALNLPDAITGKPGEQGCGPAGLPLPGPTGCYPYRQPVAAPREGGPPPGPPAVCPCSTA